MFSFKKLNYFSYSILYIYIYISNYISILKIYFAFMKKQFVLFRKCFFSSFISLLYFFFITDIVAKIVFLIYCRCFIRNNFKIMTDLSNIFLVITDAHVCSFTHISLAVTVITLLVVKHKVEKLPEQLLLFNLRRERDFVLFVNRNANAVCHCLSDNP